MNTRLGKSFGLAFVVAVGILAVMFALGTFNAGKVGAQVAVGADSISIDSPTPLYSAGANVEVELTFDSGSLGVPDFADLEIELEGYGLPDEIDPIDVYIRTPSGDPLTAPHNGFPLNVDVDGGVITLQLLDDAVERTVNIEALQTGVIITIRKRAGLTAPALAGSYDVRVGDVTEENAVDGPDQRVPNRRPRQWGQRDRMITL